MHVYGYDVPCMAHLLRVDTTVIIYIYIYIYMSYVIRVFDNGVKCFEISGYKCSRL